LLAALIEAPQLGMYAVVISQGNLADDFTCARFQRSLLGIKNESRKFRCLSNANSIHYPLRCYSKLRLSHRQTGRLSHRSIYSSLACKPLSHDLRVAKRHDLTGDHAGNALLAIAPPEQVGDTSPPACIPAPSGHSGFVCDEHAEAPSLRWVT
jgi:hypothetical protein